MYSFQNKLLALSLAAILSACGDSKPQVEAQVNRQKVAEVAAAAASAAYGKRLAEDKIDMDKRAAFEAKKAEEESLAKQRQLDLEQLVVTGKVADLAVEARKGFDRLNGRSNTSLYGTATLIIDGAAGVLPYDGYRAISKSCHRARWKPIELYRLSARAVACFAGQIASTPVDKCRYARPQAGVLHSGEFGVG